MRCPHIIIILVFAAFQTHAVEVVAKAEPTYTLPPMPVRDYGNLLYFAGAAVVVALLFWAAGRFWRMKQRQDDQAFREGISKDYEDAPNA